LPARHGAVRHNAALDDAVFFRRMKMSRRVAALPIVGLAVVVFGTVARSADAPRSGADVYRDYCAVCHSGGWQGAPIANEASEWAERVSAGADVMLKNAKQGLNAMPPMGTCVDCTDDELKSAIAEMLR
jgi:cytochrome c5